VGDCEQSVIARISVRPQRGVAGRAGRLYDRTNRREKHARSSPYGGAFHASCKSSELEHRPFGVEPRMELRNGSHNGGCLLSQLLALFHLSFLPSSHITSDHINRNFQLQFDQSSKSYTSQQSSKLRSFNNQFNSNTNTNSSSHFTSSLLTFIPSHIRSPSRLVIKDSTTYLQRRLQRKSRLPKMDSSDVMVSHVASRLHYATMLTIL